MAWRLKGDWLYAILEYVKKSKENWYTLTKKHNISSGTMSRLKNNKDISTRTINDLCRILDCHVEDILRYIP